METIPSRASAAMALSIWRPLLSRIRARADGARHVHDLAGRDEAAADVGQELPGGHWVQHLILITSFVYNFFIFL